MTYSTKGKQFSEHLKEFTTSSPRGLQLFIYILQWVSTRSNLFLGGHAATANSLQSCPTLCDPIDSSPPGSPAPGILQARTLEWVAFSSAWKWKVKGKSLSRIWLLATPWTAAYQAPPSMGFSRQECWSGCHCVLQGDMWWCINIFSCHNRGRYLIDHL